MTAALVGFMFCQPLFGLLAGIVKAELFPPAVRALGVGFPYTVGNAAFGGTAEYVALSLRSQGNTE
jgi:MHS family alpha-ketoglutarate permease-like MFS transporter